jgi:hypothetical protein
MEVPLAILEEAMAVGPRLVSRTRRQVEIFRQFGGHIPCIGQMVKPSERVRIPGREAPERLTVLDVLKEQPMTPLPEEAEDLAAEEAFDAVSQEPGASASSDYGSSPIDTTLTESPTEAALPIPEFDSLAASQVVPRLATLNNDELDLVDRYERAHRNRQTILNRVAQLMSL